MRLASITSTTSGLGELCDYTPKSYCLGFKIERPRLLFEIKGTPDRESHPYIDIIYLPKFHYFCAKQDKVYDEPRLYYKYSNRFYESHILKSGKYCPVIWKVDSYVLLYLIYFIMNFILHLCNLTPKLKPKLGVRISSPVYLKRFKSSTSTVAWKKTTEIQKRISLFFIQKHHV